MTFKNESSLKARLVVQDLRTKDLARSQRLLPPHPVDLVRFPDICCVTWFVKCAFLQGNLDEQHADDKDDDACKIESAQPVSDTFCEPVPELSRKLIGAPSVCSSVEGRVRSCQRSKKMVSSCCHRSSKHERRSISHGTLLVDFPRRKRRHSCSVFGMC